jgi:lysophospholipase L1-like esterase
MSESTEKQTAPAGANRRMARFGLVALALFHLFALYQATLARPCPIPEWRKGPLVYDASPYSSMNAHRVFWPAAALVLDVYVFLALAWKRLPARVAGGRTAAALVPTAILAVSLGVGEAATRAFIRQFMFLQCRPHPDLLWFNRPNLRNHVDATDAVPKSTNSRGFRGREEVSAEKPAGEFRIFLVGDSSTFGLGVPDNATYGHVLEGELHRLTGRPVRVINSGCPGHTSLEGLVLLKDPGLALKPDLIVWAFNNDPCLDVLPEKARFPDSPLARALDRLLYRSDLYILFHQVARDVFRGWNPDKYRQSFRREDKGWVRRIPFEDYRDDLRQFVELARGAGSGILFLRMPLNRPICEKTPIYLTSFDDKYRNYLAEYCATNNLPFLDLESQFLAQYDPALFLPGHLFHPSIPGHRIVGEKAAEYIVARQLISPGRQSR